MKFLDYISNSWTPTLNLMIIMSFLGFSLMCFGMCHIIVSMKSNQEQISTLQKFVIQDSLKVDFMKRQSLWNRTSTKVDSGILARIAKLEKLATDHRIGNLRGIE